MAKTPRRYRVQFSPSAAKALGKLARDVQRRIGQAIDGLETDPHPPGSKKLAGEDDLYRIRVGDYRVIYQVENRKLIVLIVSIGHRRDIYRKGK